MIVIYHLFVIFRKYSITFFANKCFSMQKCYQADILKTEDKNWLPDFTELLHGLKGICRLCPEQPKNSFKLIGFLV